MKILVTAASASAHISGVQRHVINLVRCLLLNPEVSQVHMVLAPWQRAMAETSGLTASNGLAIHYPNMGRGAVARNLWYYNELPKLVLQIRPNLVHLSYPVPIDAKAIPCPIVLTLHDLYPYEIPRNFGPYQFVFNRCILHQCIERVDRIACVSDTTAARFRQYTSTRLHDKATRIYNCVEPEAVCATQPPLPGWHGEPFLLTVAQHRRNKNLPLLLRAFHGALRQDLLATSTRLVIVGIQGPETTTLHSLAARLGLQDRVLFLQGLSQAELQWCYTRCEGAVLPSTTEGFGLPVAEALMAGCRVICSDIPAFREIGGAHCDYIALNRNAEINLAAGIGTLRTRRAILPVSFPHLSAAVLSTEYAALYRNLLITTGQAAGVAPAASVRLVATEKGSPYETL